LKKPLFAIQKKISVFKVIPENAIAIRLGTDSTTTFFFDRKEWYGEVDKLPVDSAAKKEYIDYIASEQRINGVISTSDLPNNISNQTSLSTVSTTWKIFNILLPLGHVYIKYSDGSRVSTMISYRRKTRIGKTRYFIDKDKGNVIYSLGSSKTVGGFYM
jgi:hypothetical protein